MSSIAPKEQFLKKSDQSLALSAPQHYHVGIYVFEKLDGANFVNSTHLDLLSNSVPLAKLRALSLAGGDKRELTHINQISQCHEPDHLVGLNDGSNPQPAN